MWFKRRKKTEQDHALSESLRSLQSLLSETGRHEPDLDPRHVPADDTDAEESDDSWPAAGPPLAANPGNGNRPRQEHRDAPAAETEMPGGSGNRWRDLNLSFDAEPVVPRARRTEVEDAAAPPESTLDADPGSAATVEEQEPEDTETEPAVPADPAYGLDEESTDDANVPEPEDEARGAATPVDHGLPHEPDRSLPDSGTTDASDGGDASIITDQNRDDDDYDFPSHPEDEFLVLDLEEPQRSPPVEAETGAPSAGEPTEHLSPGSGAVIEDRLPGPAADQPPTIEENEQDEPGAEHEEATRNDPDADTVAEADDPPEPALGEATALEPPADEPETADEPSMAEDDEQAEDQLHLELESSAVSEADIPVLTNAVYVPEPPPQEQEAAPGPPESPHEEPIARCIDNFRVRLQLMGLNTLSTAQERELHDSLVEFLDEIEHD